MKTIAITGGKGGTGKSTVSVLLANKFRSENNPRTRTPRRRTSSLRGRSSVRGKKVVLCDCDVECPNDHLLLGQKLEKPVKNIYAKFPKLNKEKCTKCGLCVKKCPSNAIFMSPNQYPVFLHELCAGCGLCWNICPFGAIEVEKKITGEIFVNEQKAMNKEQETNFWLVTGRSVGIIEETGPIVSEVRKFAEKFARGKKADYLLLDTAAGMHCSVIRALINVDLAYAVSEPTPLGAHDLELILKLLQELEVPAKVVLNQADLGNRQPIDQIAENFGAKMEFEIPYSKEIVAAYSRGKLGEINLVIGKG